MGKFTRAISFSLVSAGNDIVGFVSGNVGSPFRIVELQFSSTVMADDLRRLRLFVAVDKAPAGVIDPSGINVLNTGGGSRYFVPTTEVSRVKMNYDVPAYDRYLKMHLDNGVAGACVVSGSMTLEIQV